MAAKKKEVKPISIAVAAGLALVAFLLMGMFLVYIFSSGGNDDTPSDVSIEQSFDAGSSLEPPPTQVEVKETMADANVGDAVIFGKYEQNGNDADGKEALEWIVLEKQEDKILLISRYCIENLPYNTERTAVAFNESTLCAFLNGDFVKNAFNESESGALVADGDIKVGLLSNEQAEKYYEYDSWRACSPTEYAMGKGARAENGYCWWWLADNGNFANSASYVHFNGTVQDKGFAVDYDLVAVRPVIWVNPDTEQEELESSDVSDEPSTEASSQVSE